MKFAHNIVLAALLGFMSFSEVAEAVQRHHHHQHPQNYVQFIEDVHPEGVTLYKDFGVTFDGYPMQSFAQWGKEVKPQEMKKRMSLAQAKDLVDSKMVDPVSSDTKVVVKEPTPKEELEKTAEVEQANMAKAQTLEAESKATPPKGKEPDAVAAFMKK